VTLPQTTGEGGRNQQFALWCASEAARRGVAATVLSVGSDGIDGNSQVAGAVCDEATPERAKAMGLSVGDALERFDTTPLLRAVGATIETGPTGNNLRDLRMLLFE
jgi:glycerate 2-kinase